MGGERGCGMGDGGWVGDEEGIGEGVMGDGGYTIAGFFHIIVVV